MGKYSTLRWFMKDLKAPTAEHILKDCHLVIEGNSYFRQHYKESGFNFILGGEFDRYAAYLKNILTFFIKSNVKCYVIFTGAMKMDIEKRKVTHQKIIDDRKNIVPGDKSYYDPVFTKNLHRKVLEELGIKYCVTEYNARETLLDVSRELNCPVLTHNFEQCLLGMSCIIPGSIWYDDANKHITCKIRTPEFFNQHITICHEMKPIFWTILDENLPLYDKISEIIGYKPKFPVKPLLHWIRKQGKEHELVVDKLEKMLGTETQKKIFRESIDEIKHLIFYHRESRVLRYLKGELDSFLDNGDQDIQENFINDVMIGKISSVYINLKNNGTFSGSWVIFDEKRRDALLPSMDIVMYAHSLLWDSPQSLTFIGRLGSSVYIANMPPRNSESSKNFEKFVEDTIPGFDWSLLKPVPEDCWLLIVTLVYYISKANRDFLTAANSILLSYVMLGPVSGKVGLLRRNNIASRSLDAGDEENGICTYKDCLDAAKAMIEYFDEGNIKDTFDRGVVHELAEFQHCLQQMNYLNQLCGERIKDTNYYKTYNGTFIFNVLLQLRDHDDPMIFFENHFKTSLSVLNLYKDIKGVFDSLLLAAI